MRFARALKEKKGFVIKPVQEDGACLFRAVCKEKPKYQIINLFIYFSSSSSADQVFGDEEMHATVRQNCMDYIVSLFH
jgi:OTU domain-containing protein 5